MLPHMRSLTRGWRQSRRSASRSTVASVELLEGRTLLSDVQVPLATSFNQTGIYTDGSWFLNSGGLDYYGYALSANQLGSTRTWDGHTFTFGAPNVRNVVHGGYSITIPVPQGSYLSVNLLATGVNHNQPDQRFVLNYTDDTHVGIYQSISDWSSPQYYRNESVALATPYRNDHSGGRQYGNFYVYGYTFAVNPAKTLQSITLPSSGYTMVLAVTLSDSDAPITVPAAPSNVAAVAQSSSEIRVSWTAPSGPVTSYNLYRGTTPTFDTVLPYRTGLTSTTFFDTNLAPSSTYYYRVAAVNDAGISPRSLPAGATTNSTQTGTVVQVLLNRAFNRIGIYNDYVTFPANGGLDCGGAALSGNLLSSGAYWLGNQFRFGTSGVNNVVRGGPNLTVSLQDGQFSSLQVLATSVNGNLPNQTFTVLYTDGTSQTFTRNVSDWFTPQYYPGESIAVSMPYRNLSNGSRDNRTFRIYGFSLALDATKTVQSLTLPTNSNCIIFAADLLRQATAAPVAPAWVTATPSGTGRLTVSWQAVAGASSYDLYRSTTPGGEGMVPYRTNITGTIFADTNVLFATTYYYTVAARNSFGPSVQSSEASATTLPAPAVLNVALDTAFNRAGIWADGSRFGGGLDGSGSALSGNLLCDSVLWNGQTFTIGAANANNVVSGGTTIQLPAGKYSSLSFLATATNGNQAAQTFTVRYTDGSSQTFTQGISDWDTPQAYSGESVAVAMNYRNTSSGSREYGSFNVYGYTFNLNPAKVVQSLVLPWNQNVHVLAVNLTT